MSKELLFATEAPSWLKAVKDKDVFSAVFGLIVSHKIGNEEFTEEGLKEELAELGTLTESQQKEAFDLMIAHKA